MPLYPRKPTRIMYHPHQALLAKPSPATPYGLFRHKTFFFGMVFTATNVDIETTLVRMSRASQATRCASYETRCQLHKAYTCNAT